MKPRMRRGEDLEWAPAALHKKLFQQALVPADEAGELNLHLWQVLRERIEPGGAVLPHFHDTAEIIHFLEGELTALLGEERYSCKPGDTLIVPAGTVHGVSNRGAEPTEQISFFIPEKDKDKFGYTELVPGPDI